MQECENLTLRVPHPETVSIRPEAGSNSAVGGGNKMAWAEGTLRSNGASNYIQHRNEIHSGNLICTICLTKRREMSFSTVNGL